MDAGILFVAIGALVLLAVTSQRYGVDSRPCFPSKERELAGRGMSWRNSPARDRLMAREVSDARRRRLGEDRVASPYAAWGRL